MAVRLFGVFPDIEEYWGIDPYEIYDKKGGPTILKQFKTDEDWDDLYARTCIKLSRYPQHNLMRLPSEAASKFFPKRYFDFVFIDGNHLYPYVKKDVECWLPKVKHGGGICGHDYGISRLPGVKRAVDELIKEPVILPGSVWFHHVK